MRFLEPVPGISPAGLPEHIALKSCLLVSDASSTISSSESGFPTVSELSEGLPQYEIAVCIETGARSAVYEARHPVLQREVMIRVLKEPDTKDLPRLMERLRRRARIVHPKIVAMYDFGRARGGHLYLATERVNGRMLARMIHEGEITPKRAYQLGLQICEALQIVHDHAMPHGALNTRTVFVTHDWQVKLTGIGMVPLSNGELSWTDEGASSIPADIWALGAVMQEMLTLRHPSDPSPGGRPLPQAFAMALSRCFKSNLELRYASASDVRNALSAALDSARAAFGEKPPTVGVEAAPSASVAAKAAQQVAAVQPAAAGHVVRPSIRSAPQFSWWRRTRMQIDRFLLSALRTGLHLSITVSTLLLLLLLTVLREKVEFVLPAQPEKPQQSQNHTVRPASPPPQAPVSTGLGAMPAAPVIGVDAGVMQKPVALPPSLTPKVPTAAERHAQLDAQYLRAVQDATTHALDRVKLDELPFLRRELERLQSKLPLPLVDAPELPAVLKRLRDVYRAELAKIDAS